MTYLVQYDEEANDRYLWHIGGAYDYSQLTANTAAGSPSPVPFYQSKVLPEFGPLGSPETPQPFGQAFASTPPAFLDTGKYQASNFSMYGLETVWQAGATSFQAEWMGTVVESPVGAIFYHGAYGQLAYRLTGEHRVYYKRMGAFGNPVPFTNFIALRPGGIVGWGAWEIAARLSYVDLRNPASLNPFYLSGTSRAGNGLLTDTTLGLTWFMNENLLDNVVKGFSAADLFVTRVQVSF
jgi:phosphate-selective porin OprO/OprP